MQNQKILVAIPTYNERENVQILHAALTNLDLNLDMLFIDDNSPDGTGKVIDDLVARDRHVHVLHRERKMGLGTAHIAAYDYAKQHGYSQLITMDADLTHDPSYIPALLTKQTQTGADIVIGSRYARGGTMKGWNSIRLPFTYFWRSMIKNCLGLPFDSTGAFRLYNVAILNPAIYKKISSQGFSFCMESLYRFSQYGAKITEVPIIAQSRIHGQSKLSGKIMREAAYQMARLSRDRFCSAIRGTSKKERQKR